MGAGAGAGAGAVEGAALIKEATNFLKAPRSWFCLLPYFSAYIYCYFFFLLLLLPDNTMWQPEGLMGIMAAAGWADKVCACVWVRGCVCVGVAVGVGGGPRGVLTFRIVVLGCLPFVTHTKRPSFGALVYRIYKIIANEANGGNNVS